jgi:hypothetical protein
LLLGVFQAFGPNQILVTRNISDIQRKSDVAIQMMLNWLGETSLYEESIPPKNIGLRRMLDVDPTERITTSDSVRLSLSSGKLKLSTQNVYMSAYSYPKPSDIWFVLQEHDLFLCVFD